MSTTALSPIASAIKHDVRRFYEAFPYPRYALTANPRWQEGYASSPAFARTVAGEFGFAAPPVWIVGCGEILPQVIAHWVPRSQRLWCLDLSRHSLRRARIRLAKSLRTATCMPSSLEDVLAKETLPGFSHIDAYGVLHHTAEPLANLRALSDQLLPGGTMRLMVYNTAARKFIQNIQAALRLLGLSPFVRRDVVLAKDLLEVWAKTCPHIKLRLGQLGTSTLNNRSRFVDTFMHPRECRLSLSDWWQAIEDSGLVIRGLFDRYGELDDLAPSLWQPPTQHQLQERVDDLRFENNFEFYLFKPGQSVQPGKSLKPYLAGPPRSWFTFEETRAISWQAKWTLWHEYVQAIAGQAQTLSLALPQRTLYRLFRIGAVLPTQLTASQLAGASRPLCSKMEPPRYPTPLPLDETDVPVWLRSKFPAISVAKREHAERRLFQAAGYGTSSPHASG